MSIPSFYTQTKICQKFGANVSKYAVYGMNGHSGIDYSNSYTYAGMLIPWKVSVPALESGTVIFSGDKRNNYGNVVIVDSPSGEWWYCHLDRCTVSVGTGVGVGQQVGVTGKSGNTAYYHLHLGWRRKPIDLNNGNKGFADPQIYINNNLKEVKMEMPYKEGDEIKTSTGRNTLGYRREPGINSELLAVAGLETAGRLKDGTILRVIGNAAQADGYLWIDVDVRPSFPGESNFPTGWVAIKKNDGASYTKLHKSAEVIQSGDARNLLNEIKAKIEQLDKLI